MKLHQGSSGTSSAAADVLLCPGVKVLSPRKLTKEQLSGKDDEVMGNGFGANVQLLDTDIDHLQEIFPGEPAQLLKEMLKDAIPPEAWLPSYPDVNIVEEKLREMWRQRRLRAIRRARSGSRSGSAASLWRETNAITGAGGSGEADRYSTAGSERSRARASSTAAGGRTSGTGSLLHRIDEHDDDEEDEEEDDEWGSEDDDDDEEEEEEEDEEEGGDEEEDALEDESVPSGSDLGGDYDDEEGEDGSSAAPTYPRPGICRIAHPRYDRTAPPPSDYHSEHEEDEDNLPAVDVDMPVLHTAHGGEKEFVQAAKGWWAVWEKREQQKEEEARQRAEEEEEGGGGRSSRASRGSKQPLQRSPQSAPVRPSARRAGGTGTGTGTGTGDTAAGTSTSVWQTAGSSGSTRATTKAAARIVTAPKRKAAEISPPSKRVFHRGTSSSDDEEEEEEEDEGAKMGKKRAKVSSGYALSKKHSRRRHGYSDDEDDEEDSDEEEEAYHGTGGRTERKAMGKPSSAAHGNAKQARKGRHVPQWRRLLEAGGTYVSDEEGDGLGAGAGESGSSTHGGTWRGAAAVGRHTQGTEGAGGKAAAHRASAASGSGKSSVLMGLRVKTSPPSHGGRRTHGNLRSFHVADGSAFRSIAGAGGTGKYKTR